MNGGGQYGCDLERPVIATTRTASVAARASAAPTARRWANGSGNRPRIAVALSMLIAIDLVAAAATTGRRAELSTATASLGLLLLSPAHGHGRRAGRTFAVSVLPKPQARRFCHLWHDHLRLPVVHGAADRRQQRAAPGCGSGIFRTSRRNFSSPSSRCRWRGYCRACGCDQNLPVVPPFTGIIAILPMSQPDLGQTIIFTRDMDSPFSSCSPC